MWKETGGHRRALLVGIICTVLAANGVSRPDACLASSVDDAVRAAIVDTVSSKLRELYVYPDVAEQMAMLMEAKLARGDYEATGSLDGFADALNRDLLSVFPDGHLAVTVLREGEGGRADDQEWWERHAEQSRFNNFGLHSVRRLAANVGYLELREFDYPELAGETLVAAMQFLAHSDAVIVDLRRNPGGRGELSQVLVSYFFEDHRVHFLTEDDGVRDNIRQWWTLPYVPGTRVPDAPLYLLTSRNTGSAAEEFAFALQRLGRATVVGDTTAGAAHKTHRHAYPELGIEIHIPDGRSFDPVSGEDWEGVGVTPDVAVDAERALEAAHSLAVEELLSRETGAEKRFRLEWARRALEAEQTPIVLDREHMQKYVGRFGSREIALDGERLYYRREGRARFELIPLGEDWFRLRDLDYFRVRFLVDSGVAMTLIGVYDDGSENPSRRTVE